MFKFLSKLSARREAEARAAAESAATEVGRYRALLRKAVASDNLSDAEADELDALHRRHGRGADLADVAKALARHRQLSAVEATGDKVRHAVRAAEVKLADHEAATAQAAADHERAMGDRARQADRLRAELAARVAEAEQLEAAAAERDAVEQALWFIFDRPDPQDAAAERAAREARLAAAREAEARKCHVVHALGVPPVDGTPRHQVIDLSSLLSSAGAGTSKDAMVARVVALTEAVPLPGQDPEDVAELFAAVKACDGPKAIGYLLKLSPGESVRPLPASSRAHVFEAGDLIASARKGDGNADPRGYLFVRHPAQSRREFDRLKSELAEAWRLAFTGPPAVASV